MRQWPQQTWQPTSKTRIRLSNQIKLIRSRPKNRERFFCKRTKRTFSIHYKNGTTNCTTNKAKRMYCPLFANSLVRLASFFLFAYQGRDRLTRYGCRYAAQPWRITGSVFFFPFPRALRENAEKTRRLFFFLDQCSRLAGNLRGEHLIDECEQ